METAAVSVERLAQYWCVRVEGLVTSSLVAELRRLSAHPGPTKVNLRAAWLSTDGLEALRAWHAAARGELELLLPQAVAAFTPPAASPPPQSPVDLPAMLAHELRGPLAITHLRLQSLAARLSTHNLEPETADCRSAIAGVEAVSRLFEIYLTASRPWRTTPVDLSEICRAAAKFAENTAREPRIEVDAPEAMRVRGEPQALQQLVYNLLRNALESGAEPPAARIRATRADAMVRLEVTDQGPGFPSEVLEHPTRPRRSTKPGGMGIGLLLCHWIVERHRGTIRLGAAPGGGALVRVDLPAAPGLSGSAE